MSQRLPPKPAPRTLGPITRTDVVIYQGASGDFEPMHHDEPFARAAGLPAPIVVGMYPAGAMCAWATDWLGPERVRQVQVRWKAPAWPGDVLEIDGDAQCNDDGGVEVTLRATNQQGVVVLTGTAIFVAEAGG